jgi:hypothetical protein
VTAIETTGSGLIAALEQSWDQPQPPPNSPEVVVLTGTSLSPSAVHLDATGPRRRRPPGQGHPTEHGQAAALDRSAARRKPELFVAGECLAEGPARPCRPCCMRPSTPPRPRGQRHLPRGKYHNKREFVALAGELGLAWPDGQRPHPVIGFSDVQLTEHTVADSADTLTYLDAAIRLDRDPVGLLGGQEKGQGGGEAGRDGEGSSPPARRASGSRSSVAASRPGRSGSGPGSTPPDRITCGVRGQDFHPRRAWSSAIVPVRGP